MSPAPKVRGNHHTARRQKINMLLGSKSATGNAGSTNRGRILCLLSSAPDPIIHGSVNRQLWLFDTGRSVGLEFRAVVVMAWTMRYCRCKSASKRWPTTVDL